MSLFNFHTYHIDAEPCLLNVDTKDLLPSYPEHVRLSIGVHPWKVKEDWQDALASVRQAAMREDVWAIGECGLDKLHGEALSLQMEAFRAHIAIAEEVQKPMVVHCVRAFDELLMLRRELEASCKHESENGGGNVKHPQPWVIHGFRGKPEQAKQLMTKGMLLSFGHQYNLETLRFVFISSRPFYLETDDLHLSVRQIYGQVAHHLDVDVVRLSHLCDPRTTLFSRQIP
jgi:TatD DNase family protein